MVKLPNGDNALVSLEKFTEYLLNTEHPTGRHKARVFKAALGLTLENAEFLRDFAKQIAATEDAQNTGTDALRRALCDRL